MDILGGIDHNPSPRKVRNRTGTMVSSEALIMAGELGEGGGSPGAESESVAHLSPASTEMPESGVALYTSMCRVVRRKWR